MNTMKLLRYLSKRFPKRYARMNHDYVGLMTGKLPNEVHKIFLCLDCDWETLPLIKEFKPDLVLTHHPFIYGTRAKVFKRDPSKKELSDLLDSLGYPVYSMHTNFDIGVDGMNDALAEALGLQDVKVVEGDMMMRGGKLPRAMKASDFAKYANNALNVDYSLLINSGKEEIETVAIVGGAGSGRYTLAKERGYDIFISGDAPHHIRREIVNAKYNYLDMPHEIEKIFIRQMNKLLLEFDPTLEIKMVDHEKLPRVIFR